MLLVTPWHRRRTGVRNRRRVRRPVVSQVDRRQEEDRRVEGTRGAGGRRILVDHRFNPCLGPGVRSLPDQIRQDRILRGRIRGDQPSSRFLGRVLQGLRCGHHVRRSGDVRRRTVRCMDGDRTIVRGCTITIYEIWLTSIWRRVRALSWVGSFRIPTSHTSLLYRPTCMAICRRLPRDIRSVTTKDMWWSMTR